MSQKMLLAEGLDVLRKAEAREYEVDKDQARISSSGRYRKDLSRLLDAYGSIHEEYVRGLDILNHVRRTAKQTGRDSGLVEFCTGKILAYMDRCDGVRQKEDNILLPLEQMVAVAKPGYDIEQPIFVVDGPTIPITKKEPFVREETVTDGSYLLILKNLDSYSVAAPRVTVLIDVIPQRGAHQRIEKTIPCQCGWRRVIGIVGSALVKITIRSDGMMRDSHMDVSLHKMTLIKRGGGGAGGGNASFGGNGTQNSSMDNGLPDMSHQAAQGGNQWIGQLPKISDDELALLTSSNVPRGALPAHPPVTGPRGGGGGGARAVDTAAYDLENMTVPYMGRKDSQPTTVIEKVTVNPANATCSERLMKLRAALDSWPRENVVVAPLNRDEQYTLQAVIAMPIPTDIEES